MFTNNINQQYEPTTCSPTLAKINQQSWGQKLHVFYGDCFLANYRAPWEPWEMKNETRDATRTCLMAPWFFMAILVWLYVIRVISVTLHRSVIGGLAWLYSDDSFSFYITAHVKDVFPIASTTTPGPNWASKEHSTVLPVGSCRRSPGLDGFDLIKMGINWSGLECIPHLWSSHVHWKDSMDDVRKMCADEVKSSLGLARNPFWTHFFSW